VSSPETTIRKRPVWIRAAISVFACLVLLGGAGGASYMIFKTEPTAEREAQTKRTAALVETITVRRGDHRPTLAVLGQVRPSRDVVLTPRVSGQAIALEPTLVPGGLVEEDGPLLHIDPADFRRAVTMRRSELRQVEMELAVEQGRQRVAQREYELLGQEINDENRSLVLREPQIETIRARLDAARASLELAELELERTTVRAPFDAQILERDVNVGSQVAAGDRLGRLVGIDEYWVIASVPVRDLRWLEFGDGSSSGSTARVRHSTAWPEGEYRDARVTRLIGEVDQTARLARVLLTVPDPLARGTNGPPIILGTVLQVRIEGSELAGVVRLDRDYLRQDNTVWVMVDGALDIRRVQVAFRDAQHAYIDGGLDDGELVVTTSLSTVTDGLALRTAQDTESESDQQQAGAQRP